MGQAMHGLWVRVARKTQKTQKNYAEQRTARKSIITSIILFRPLNPPLLLLWTKASSSSSLSPSPSPYRAQVPTGAESGELL
ncbi:hypothetical protein PG997_000755 [Apiospora hydei]|uniref:Uncharacterized protein n=1 Tax=Apiospora hydei TaxID=1337664 RepID=A0ABR1XBJ8_9PEZI